MKQNKKMKHFFNNVKIRLGYYDWELVEDVVPTEGMCHHHNKTIAIGSEVKDYKYLILHEFAHIDTCRFCNHPHNKTFWKRFEYLLKKFLKRRLHPNDIKWRNECMSGFQGYYRKCYQKY